MVIVASREQAKSVEAYLRTRFFRFLVSLRKISQHAPKPTYLWVPQQQWDHTWTDAELFGRYGIDADEQEYISEIVRVMPG
jgi:site-specific DNA-methyltransferase (adenine-specific)